MKTENLSAVNMSNQSQIAMSELINEQISAASTNDPTLRIGDNNSSVGILQQLLNFRGAGLVVDGAFGEITRARVLEFQQAIGLVRDGVVGPKTWAAVRAGLLMTRVEGGFVNVRSQPIQSAPVLNTVPTNTPVQILSRTTVTMEGYRWFQVRLSKPVVVGWVREDLVYLLLPFTIPAPMVNGIGLRVEPRIGMSAVNLQIEEAIRREVSVGFRDRVRYLYQPLFDASGDTVMDRLLVYLFGSPLVCGTGGCTGLMLQTSSGIYRTITRFTVLQHPVIITDQMTQGYPDLIVYTAGGGVPAAYRRLKFDGRTYPSNPTTVPALPAGTVVVGRGAIANRISPDLAAPLVGV